MKNLELKHSPEEVLDYFLILKESVLDKVLEKYPKELILTHREFIRDIETILKFVKENTFPERVTTFFNPNDKES